MTGEEFRSIRKSLGLSQERLAREMDVSLRCVVRLEEQPVVRRKYEFSLYWIRSSLNETADA